MEDGPHTLINPQGNPSSKILGNSIISVKMAATITECMKSSNILFVLKDTLMRCFRYNFLTISSEKMLKNAPRTNSVIQTMVTILSNF